MNTYQILTLVYYYASLFRGSSISKIIGLNVQENDKFEREVRMWVFEEIVDGRKLSEVINEKHENVKYLPGITLPDNVVSWWDIVDTLVLLYLGLELTTKLYPCTTLAQVRIPFCYGGYE